MAQRFALAASLALPCIQAARVKLHEEGGCNVLTNLGSFSTVEVEVGTPPQKLNIVADTGSDLTLVESCACVDAGACSKAGRCFRGGQGTSSSFQLDKAPMGVTITYGSGPLDSVVATDLVKVGNITAKMDHSLLLITKNRLQGNIQLDGILGLGLPHGDSSLADQQGFLDQAKVDRFAMCFNDGGKDGLLRLGNQVTMDKPLQGIGKEHWGVDFRGVSIGDSKVEGSSAVCTKVEHAGQETPCGAIIDSGTTLILAPQEHLTSLLASICDGWQKCKDKSAAMMLSVSAGQAQEAQALAKAKALHAAAADCQLEGMPSIHFHLRGKDGTKETLELASNDYMIETQQATKLSQYLGFAKPSRICKVAFDTHQYKTVKNGPVWLLGTPFFYKYNVAYDRSTSPPSLSFNRNGCGSCVSSGGASFLAQRTKTRRHLDTEPRVSFINTTRPL